jgi:hypothetical protein
MATTSASLSASAPGHSAAVIGRALMAFRYSMSRALRSSRAIKPCRSRSLTGRKHRPGPQVFGPQCLPWIRSHRNHQRHHFDTLHKQAADLAFLTDRFNRCAKLIEVIRTAAGILKLIKANSAP